MAAVDYNNVRISTSSVGDKIELSAPADSVAAAPGVLTAALPGAPICPATVGGTMCFLSGTSAASPHVAAAAALLKAYNPSLSNSTIRTQLDCAALYLGDPTWYGNGLLKMKNVILNFC